MPPIAVPDSYFTPKDTILEIGTPPSGGSALTATEIWRVALPFIIRGYQFSSYDDVFDLDAGSGTFGRYNPPFNFIGGANEGRGPWLNSRMEIPHGTVSGTFQATEKFTATGGKAGRVISVSGGVLEYAPRERDEQLVAGDVVTGSTSGASTTVSGTSTSGDPGPFSHGLYTGVTAKLEQNELVMVAPPYVGSDMAGSFQLAYIPDDDIFDSAKRALYYRGTGTRHYVSYRVKINAAQLSKQWRDFDGDTGPDFKLSITGQGAQVQQYRTHRGNEGQATTNTRLETVIQPEPGINNGVDRFGGWKSYHSNGNNPIGGFHPWTHWGGYSADGEASVPEGGGAIRYQSAIAGCLYPQTWDPPCKGILPDTWYTVTIEIQYVLGGINPGFSGRKKNRLRMWAAPDGSPYTLIADTMLNWPNGYPMATPDAGYSFGQHHLTIYTTSKDPTENHAQWETRYRNLVISDTRPPAGHVAGLSAIAAKAATLEPGEWALMHEQGVGSHGLTRDLIHGAGDTVTGSPEYVTEFGDKMTWDPIEREINFIGQSHQTSDPEFARHIRYREDTDTWSRQAQLTTVPGGSFVGPPPKHMYHHNTWDPWAERLYHRIYGGSAEIFYWDRRTDTYSALASVSSSFPGNKGSFDGIEYFPERDSIVLNTANWDGLFEYQFATSSWVRLANSWSGSSGSQICLYSAKRKRIWLGGGTSPNTLYHLLPGHTPVANPQQLENPPPGLAVSGSGAGSRIQWVDPVTGNLLVVTEAGQLWEYDPDRDPILVGGSDTGWHRLDGVDDPRDFETPGAGGYVPGNGRLPIHESTTDGLFNFTVAAVPIPDYGVTLFLKPSSSTVKTFLYRHA